MTIAELEARTKHLVKPPKQRVLIVDIERIKGRFEGDFFDLNDMKNRRIPADWVVEWPRSICLAWRWYGQRKIHFAAEWQPGGRAAMLQTAWDLYNQAHIVVGHNIDSFDTKKLRGEWWADYALDPPAGVKSVDTLKVARREFSLESNTLDAICKRAGIGGKVDHYDPLVARAAVDGDREAQRKLAFYNRGDVQITGSLYDRMRGWISNHPHNVDANVDYPTCNQCWSEDLARNGTSLADQLVTIAYRCNNCGGNVKSTRHHRAAITRGVR